MIIIGIAGKKRSGKNTVAKLIALMTPLKCEEFAFADELKNELARICKVPRTEIDSKKDLYRHLLQAWGVYKRDTQGKDHWCEMAIRKLVKSQAPVRIVTDVRFINEADNLAQGGATLVRVFNGNQMGDQHSSEVELDNYKFKYTINNTGTMDDLTKSVRDLMIQLNIPLK